MKKLAFLFVALMMVSLSYSQSAPKSKINVYQKLDRILSPFEDMTEYALNNNSIGITEAMNRINRAQKNQFFKQGLTEKSSVVFKQKIKSLRQSVNQNDYKKISLISADIFKFNISHFINADQLRRQFHIEHLDYMGYQAMALLKQDKVDWEAIAKAIKLGYTNWASLQQEVKDSNLKNTFNQLFSGLQLSVKQKNPEAAKIFASMDLSLVDVLEVSF